MRKIKYILATAVLAASLVSCETEAIDEKLLDENIPGKPILRFDLNNSQTIVTDKVDVEWSGGGAFTIKAKLSILNLDNHNMENNPEKYLSGYLRIEYNVLGVGHFPARLSLDNLSNNNCHAVFDIQYVTDDDGFVTREWVAYSTRFASESQEVGFSNITHVNVSDNEEARYLNGNFEFIVYPTPDNESGKVQPLRLSTGSYNYVNY